MVQPNVTTPRCAKHGSTLEVFKHYVLSRPPFCVHAVCDVILLQLREHTSDVSRRGSVVDA